MKRLYIYLLSSWLIVLGICLLQGCSGAGFEKKATLMPDSISISVGEQSLLPYDVRWRGVIVNLTWNFE